MGAERPGWYLNSEVLICTSERPSCACCLLWVALDQGPGTGETGSLLRLEIEEKSCVNFLCTGSEGGSHYIHAFNILLK